MLMKLKEAELYYESVSEKLSQPGIAADQAEFRRLMQEYKRLTPIVLKYREYLEAEKRISEAEKILSSESDAELCRLASDELKETKARRELLYSELTILLIPRDPNDNKNVIVEINEELKILLLPKDPNDDKSVIVEIRGGAGGEEAALFAGDLFRMYSMYSANQGYRIDIVSANGTELGGYREISFIIEGEGAYSRFKYESGVHRVQRVPETESQGRIHTSTVTVAVLPEAEEVEIDIDPNDLKIETIKSSGAGGQHINKTESAIRILHKPTGIVVECQDERSQYKNRDRAMKILRSKLFDIKRSEQDSKIAAERRSQVGTGDRSEKIRTYNYPQSRMTDHRIGYSSYSLDSFLDGNIGDLIDALATVDAAEKLNIQEVLH